MIIIRAINQFIFRVIWNISEFLGIGLGRFAPFVFSQMIGRKGKRIR